MDIDRLSPESLRRRAVLSLILAGALLIFLGSCAQPVPGEPDAPSDDWRTVDVGGFATLRMPSDAQDTGARGIDSVAGVLRGDGYEVVYDHGRHGERLDPYVNQPDHAMRTREISGKAAVDVSFRAKGRPLPYARILQVQNGLETLTVHVSCIDADTCRVADRIFDSVTLQ